MEKITLRYEGTAAGAKALGLPVKDPGAPPTLLDKLEGGLLTTTGHLNLTGVGEPLEVEIVLDLK